MVQRLLHAFGLSVSRPIGQTLPGDLLERVVCAFAVADAICLTIVVAEAELGHVTLKVAFAHLVVRADQPALEDAEEAFHGVRGDPAGTRVFALAMVHSGVLRKLFADVPVDRGFVRHKVRVARDLAQDGLERLVGHVGNVEGANLAVTLDQRNYRALGQLGAGTAIRTMALTGLANVALVAKVGFVHFHDSTAAAKQAATVRLHGLADAMGHEPSGLESHAKHTVKLVAAHALLGGREQMDGLQPDVKADLGALEHGADRHGELFAAVFALPQAGTMGFAVQLVMILGRAAAMRADSAMGPAKALKVVAGSAGGLEVGGVQEALGPSCFSDLCP